MITQQMHENVIQWALDTLIRLNEMDLHIDVQWGSMRSSIGNARYKPTVSLVKFSRTLWPHASRQDRFETVVHEVCHIVARHRHGRSIKPHGREWKNLMIQCGVEPRVCHDVDPRNASHGVSAVQMVNVWCDCDMRSISPQRADQILRGDISLSCRECGATLRLDEIEPEETPAAHAPTARTIPNDSKESQKGLGFVMKNGRAFIRFA